MRRQRVRGKSDPVGMTAGSAEAVATVVGLCK